MALSDSVQVLPSVGPKRLEALQDLESVQLKIY